MIQPSVNLTEKLEQPVLSSLSGVLGLIDFSNKKTKTLIENPTILQFPTDFQAQ